MKNAESHRPTQRVLDIMELLASDGASAYTLTEIASRLCAPKSTLFPVVHTLRKQGYLTYNEMTARYSIGSRAYEIGMKYIQRNGVYDEILGLMQEIVKRCSESCNYAELNGGDALFLMKVDSPQAIRMVSAPGRKIPAYSSALGKALLSGMSGEEIRRLYPNGLHPITENTITDMEKLLEQLEEVKKTGIATEWEENTKMIFCFAVPIVSNGAVVAALSVAIPTFRRNDENSEAIIKLLIEARPKIELLLAASTK